MIHFSVLAAQNRRGTSLYAFPEVILFVFVISPRIFEKKCEKNDKQVCILVPEAPQHKSPIWHPETRHFMPILAFYFTKIDEKQI